MVASLGRHCKIFCRSSQAEQVQAYKRSRYGEIRMNKVKRPVGNTCCRGCGVVVEMMVTLVELCYLMLVSHLQSWRSPFTHIVLD